MDAPLRLSRALPVTALLVSRHERLLDVRGGRRSDERRALGPRPAGPLRPDPRRRGRAWRPGHGLPLRRHRVRRDWARALLVGGDVGVSGPELAGLRRRTGDCRRGGRALQRAAGRPRPLPVRLRHLRRHVERVRAGRAHHRRSGRPRDRLRRADRSRLALHDERGDRRESARVDQRVRCPERDAARPVDPDARPLVQRLPAGLELLGTAIPDLQRGTLAGPRGHARHGLLDLGYELPRRIGTTTGAIDAKYRSLGGCGSMLGAPITDERATPDGVGRYSVFERGSIYWTQKTGAHEVHGIIRDKWKELGWEPGVLGYPISDEVTTPDRAGRYNVFEGGSILPDAEDRRARGARPDPRQVEGARLGGGRARLSDLRRIRRDGRSEERLPARSHRVEERDRRHHRRDDSRRMRASEARRSPSTRS